MTFENSPLRLFDPVRGAPRTGSNSKHPAYAASPKTGVGARIEVYRRGGARKQKAGRLIYRHRDELELQVAFLDWPSIQVRDLCKDMLEEDCPPWNAKHNYRGRF